MSAQSPNLLDFAVCRVKNAELGREALDAIGGDDARLTDARTPLAHTHGTGEVTGLAALISAAITAAAVAVDFDDLLCSETEVLVGGGNVLTQP